jgi:hypothetical protein
MKSGQSQLGVIADIQISGPTAALAQRSLRDTILSGSMTLLIGSALVSAINLVYNILIARSLGAAGFGHAVSIYTVLMLLSAVTLSFQLSAQSLSPRIQTWAPKHPFTGVYTYGPGRWEQSSGLRWPPPAAQFRRI